MIDPAADHQLVSEYAAGASERAFQALVRRHVDLVYATALRQLGDPGFAEEVTQNVFMVLARKAPRLTGIQTLAGWLHRTTILEAKARIRSELRRRRREEQAAQWAAVQTEGTAPFQALAPLVDEALLHLGESDRLALVLRFFEDRSLRDVGSALGVNEEAARKRVERALERVSQFFHRHGFVLPSGLGAAGLLSSSARAAPAGLATAATQAGIAAGGTVNGIQLFLSSVMALTKAQTALLCGVVALLPLAWQAHTHSRLTREQSELDAQLLASSQVADQLEKDLRRTRDLLLRAQAGREKAELRMASLRAQSENAATRPAYHWDEASRLARVPKALLDRAKVRAAVNRRGQLSDEIKELLQLSELEARQTQAILDQFLESYYAVQARNLRAVPATAEDLKGHKPDETRVFEIAGMGESFDQLRDGLFQELGAVLGPDRLSLFREALQGWMSIHDEMKMVSGEMAVLEFGRRERFYRPKPGASGIEWGFIKLDHSGAMEVSVPLEDLPAMYQPYLQDWIRLAQSQSAARTDTQGIRAP